MSLLRFRPWLSIGSSVLVLVLFLGAVIVVLVHTKNRYERVTEDISPRYSRLAGLVKSESAINQTLAAQKVLLDQVVYDAAAGADRIGADVQQKVRDVLGSANVNVTGSQVFANKPDDKATIGTVSVSVSAITSLGVLTAGIRALAQLRPRVYLADVQLVPTMQRDAQQMNIEMRFNALYLVKP
jgi:general secretion pathway protein M